MERKLRKLLPEEGFAGVSGVRSRTMASIRGRHNRTTELRLKMVFVRAGICGWQLHAEHLPGKPDFYFPGRRVAVFVDGCFWHSCPKCGHVPKTRSTFWAAKLARNRQRDRATTKKLRAQGIKVLRVWEHCLKNWAASKELRNILALLQDKNAES